MYEVGQLDKKISFYKEIAASDGLGGQDITLVPIKKNVWCAVRPLSGKEIERFDKLNATAMAHFTVRYREDVEEDDRIEYNGKYYNIRYIPDLDERKLYTEFYAERGVAQ